MHEAAIGRIPLESIDQMLAYDIVGRQRVALSCSALLKNEIRDARAMRIHVSGLSGNWPPLVRMSMEDHVRIWQQGDIRVIA